MITRHPWAIDPLAKMQVTLSIPRSQVMSSLWTSNVAVCMQTIYIIEHECCK